MRNEKCSKILVGKPEGKRPLERPRVMLKCIIHKWDMEWIFWLRIGTCGGFV
jgi:hypothetical protein